MKPIQVLRRIAGTILFMVGIVVLIIPILPGWILIGIGLYLLSLDSPGMQRRIRNVRERYKSVERVMRIFDDRPEKADERSGKNNKHHTEV